MKVRFGTTKFPDASGRHREVVWDTAQTVNSHILLCGSSGTGKTHRIRAIVDAMQSQSSKLRIHVLDVHGDIRLPGESRVSFSETSGYGLNPLAVSADPDFGGVRKRVRAFIATLKRTSTALGSKQEAALTNMLYDVYQKNGFYADNPKTWSLAFDPRGARTQYPKRQPTLADLRRFGEYKLRAMITGSGSKALSALDKLNKRVSALERAGKKIAGGEDVELATIKADVIAHFTEYVESIETGRELEDIIRYSSKEVMASVVERLTTLDSCGIFKANPPPFDEKARVWVYDVKTLHHDEQVMFCDALCEHLFEEARAAGETSDLRTMLVIDEAHLVVSEDPGHIIARIFKESRKWGFSCLLSSQSLVHYPDDILQNAGVRALLGVDETLMAPIARKLCIDQKRLSYIRPRQSALLQLKGIGDTRNAFTDVLLA